MDADPERGRGGSPALAVVLVVVLLAGALFGYDQGVISGALTGIQREFHLTPLLVEVVTSWVTLGAMAGKQGWWRPGEPLRRYWIRPVARRWANGC